MKKMAKSQFSMLGTVGDGVKSNILTASRVKTMTAQKVHEGVTRKSVKSKHVTA